MNLTASTRHALPDAGRRPQLLGVQIHGIAWEWSIGRNTERRQPYSRMSLQKFCGAGALDLEQKENFECYASRC
jgi:hypothetical protein